MDITIYTDAGSRGNPGHSAIACMVICGENRLFGSEYIGIATNNEAEYRAVLMALTKISYLSGVERVTVFSDSKLLVNQLSLLWRVANPKIKSLYNQIRGAERNFKDVEYEWVPRETIDIMVCDQLVNECLDANQK